MISFFLILLFLIAMALLLSFVLFLLIFYVPYRDKSVSEEIPLPAGEIYKPYHAEMRNWVLETRNTRHEVFTIRSFDGLNLCGKYYEYSPDAPIELMFHGYRGSAERDLSGGMHRCFQLGHSAFIVDQRGAGNSAGNVITFGIKEHRDCLSWIDFAISHFGPDVQLILTGISMGASTVLMAAGEELPGNVMGILADCGFHSAKDVIITVAESMHLPSKLLYPFVKLGARIFGHFDFEELTPVDACARCKVPVLFFHGEEDDYVPPYMSRMNYEACAGKKKLIFVPGAGHGLCYPVASEHYINEMREFFYTSN